MARKRQTTASASDIYRPPHVRSRRAARPAQTVGKRRRAAARIHSRLTKEQMAEELALLRSNVEVLHARLEDRGREVERLAQAMSAKDVQIEQLHVLLREANQNLTRALPPLRTEPPLSRTLPEVRESVAASGAARPVVPVTEGLVEVVGRVFRRWFR